MFTSGLAKEPTKMAKTPKTQKTGGKTPIEKKIDELLPRSISLQDLKPILEKGHITMRTFERDRKNPKPQTIPLDRLKVYAQILGCEVDDLITDYTKVKSIMKSSIGKKVGMIVPILLVSFFSCAQSGTIDFSKLDTSLIKSSIVWNPKNSGGTVTLGKTFASDTFKCIMLVSDTVRNRTFHAKGHSVLNSGYLDEHKNPVPKSWMVWISYWVKSF